jgi:signal transduction histidine kinase
MLIKNSKNKFFSRISIIAVLVAIIFLIFIQYHWVISSAENDLSELYRTYTYRIFNDISEEFAIFPDPGEKLNYFRKIDGEEKLQEALVSEFNKLNTTENNQYIKSISYLQDSIGGKRYIYYSSNGWEYNQSIPDGIVDEKRGPSLIPDASDNGKVWIIFPGNKLNESTTTIIYNFDILSFYRNKVEKFLNIIDDNYELKWYYNQSGEKVDLWKENYSYSPFRVLKNKLLFIESPRLIEIPLHIIIFKNSDTRREKIFFDPHLENSQIHPLPSVHVDILYNGKALLQSKEYTLTIQWVMSLLLLIGIAAAYLIILYQINKLKQLRLREKEFVASVTHELRTPLTVISSAADNIKNGIISPERIEEYGKLISNQSGRLASMIEDILLFSRLEGKSEESPQLKDLRFSDIKKNITIYTQEIIKETEKKLQINFGSLPDSFISDGETIELILTNLITNSCKHAYSKEKEGLIRVKGFTQLPNFLILTVEDDGCGIDKSEIKHIFEPFFRGRKIQQDQIKGSGLGLYLSKRKSELLGASLIIESPYGRSDGKIRMGSRFLLKIPYYNMKGE